MLAVSWTKCAGGLWCELEKVNVAASTHNGTFIVWLGGDRARTIRVGHGQIATVVRAQRHDVKVLNYKRMGTLYVTWTLLPDYQSIGAATYLQQTLRPLLVGRFDEVAVLDVNLPWTAKASTRR